MRRHPLYAITIVALALMSPNPIAGQLRGGLQVGASAFYLRTNYDGPTYPTGSLTYGAWVGTSIRGPVGLRIEGNVSRRGFRQREDHGVRLNVVEVPLLITYDLQRSATDAAYLAAGVTGSFQRDCTQTTATPGPAGIPLPSATAPCDGSAPFNPVIANDREFSITIGGGSAVAFGATRLTLDARLLGGLTRQLAVIQRRTTDVGLRTVEFAGRTWGAQILVGFGIG